MDHFWKLYAIGLLCGWPLVWFLQWRGWWPTVHRHQWQVISAFCDGAKHWMDTDPGHISTPLQLVFVTNVVLRCACGALKHLTIPGSHTIESLRGEDSEVARVLERMK